ncbi:Aldo/keto reductase-like protein [Thozetella sp. PMI_491]|nr:Aldo/keto reductase-like protein [Thozetella sp. PMI_491]
MAPPATIPTRRLGKDGPQIPAIGFGLMGLGSAYGTAGSDEERLAILDRAWELGETNWDTASVYGDTELLVNKWFKLHPERRADIFLATKFGLFIGGTDGSGGYTLVVDSSPKAAKESVETALSRLGVEYIDLFYVHRLDLVTPVEKTMEVLAEYQKQGKIKAIGLSECSSSSLRRACKIVHVDAVQVEYSPWDLSIENEVGTFMLDACRELGVTIFAYAPLGRGFLAGQIKSPADLEKSDYRNIDPRYQAEAFEVNMKLVDKFRVIATRKGCTPAQLSLAWVLAQGDNIIPIPGTRNTKYLEENVAAVRVELTEEDLKDLRAAIESTQIAGRRIPENFLPEFNDTPEL